MKPSEMSFKSNSRLQNRKEYPNRSTNNGDMDENLNVCEWVCDIYLIIEKLKF